MAPQIIFGTANFGMEGGFLDAPSVRDILHTLKNLGISRLDTGARYPPLNPGQSERLIGEAGEGGQDDDGVGGGFLVDTKVYTDTRTDGSGDLAREKMGVSVRGSLERLRRPGGVSLRLYLLLFGVEDEIGGA
jgi:aflatoxin B1 aldehyde reductase